ALARGLATRLGNQSGLVGAPHLQANTTKRPPSTRYTIGLTRSPPLLAPVLWSSNRGAPSKAPPTRPAWARNSSMTLVLKSFAPGMAAEYGACGHQGSDSWPGRAVISPR